VSGLDPSFYDRSVQEVARELIGCELLVDGVGGVIVETEAYHQSEPACHAYAGLTRRTGVLFGAPGRAYVYLSYGIHSLVNAVCEPEGVGAAVLIRALEPRYGLEAMAERRGLDDPRLLCAGPGRLSQALGIGLSLNGRSLARAPFELRPGTRDRPEVVAAPRIGITRAADLPWRYCAAGSRFLSRAVPRELVQPAGA
jgi:DNA-3-methyladenine glycosylase